MLSQTDAAINPGNSGGALVNMNCNLIAVPNAILSKTGASHGIGFAIPVTLIKILLDSIRNGGILIHPWLGINVQHIISDMAKSLGLPIPQGVLVTSLHPASPALNNGITQGDIITAVNGQNVSTPEEFHYRIQIIPFGQSLMLTLMRNGQMQQISLQSIIPPEIPVADERVVPQNGDLLQGLKVANLSPALIAKFQLPIGTPETGVVITDIGGNLLSLELKLSKGDIIERVNQQPIDSVKSLFSLFPIRITSVTFLHGNRRLEVKKGQ
jgi:S1-C subfamily serine protease